MTVDAVEKKEDEPVLDVGDVSPENKKEEGIEDNQKVGLVTQKKRIRVLTKRIHLPIPLFLVQALRIHAHR